MVHVAYNQKGMLHGHQMPQTSDRCCPLAVELTGDCEVLDLLILVKGYRLVVRDLILTIRIQSIRVNNIQITLRIHGCESCAGSK